MGTMSGRGRGKQLTRPAWMHDSQRPPPSLSQSVHVSTPVDWEQARAADGRLYWYSLSTGQTSWTDPTSARSDLSKANQPRMDSPKDASFPWKQHRTADGRIYYYNATTKRTQWNPPSDMSSEPDLGGLVPPSVLTIRQTTAPTTDSKPVAAPGHALPNGWAEHRTQDGRTYYYHAVTRETRWERPIVSTPRISSVRQTPGTDDVSSSPQRPAAAGVSPSLPGDWAQSSTRDGKIYYYNKRTRQTSWTAPSPAPDAKRPRMTPSLDLRNIVSRVRDCKEETVGKSNKASPIVRRPRSSEGKPLTDRQAEAYFLRRVTTKESSSDAARDSSAQHSGPVSPSAEHTGVREAEFLEMMRERGITERSSWLEVMSRCTGDRRYLLVEPYGRRKHAWLKFHQKLGKARRRSNVIRRRRVAEQFQELMDRAFAKEPHDVTSLDRCHPESVRLFERDARYKAVDERERHFLIKSFFTARARRGSLERAKRRKEALEKIRGILNDHIHPSLLPPKEQNCAVEQNGTSTSTTAPGGNEKEAEVLKFSGGNYGGSKKQYFDDHTRTQDLELFIQNTPHSTVIDKNDMTGLIRSWKRHVISMVREKKARERESRRAQQRELRAAFRNGVEGMILSGRLPVNPRWKDVREVLAKEEFARTEAELGSRAADLFEHGVRLFEERVQCHREKFKRLLKDGGVEVTDTTTIEELQQRESLADFLKNIEGSVAFALLLDRQRKESKRRQKERDRAIAVFEDLIKRSSISAETAFQTATESWKEVPDYQNLQRVLGKDEMNRAFDEFMRRRSEKEERRMKRKFGQQEGVPYNVPLVPGVETVKRARISIANHEALHFRPTQQQEEENGWAAAVSAKPVNENDKLEERERRKREILDGLVSSHTHPLGADGN